MSPAHTTEFACVYAIEMKQKQLTFILFLAFIVIVIVVAAYYLLEK